ncbi:MAG: polysaccharide biosynthesis protein, partial [Burkholderiaceae bacterium]|nr:polysaccharide biosynthesis protein [Microbacteriaceae bacterium]
PAIALVGLIIWLLGLWPVILGNGLMGEGGATAALVCALVFGLVLPLTVGQRILVGLGKTSTQIATQAVIAPFILLSVLAFIALGLPAGSFVAVLSYLGTGLVSLLCIILAARAIRPQVGRAIRDIPRLTTVKNVPILATAGPMLVQMLILPIATQTDRLLLSHLTVGDELAQYNLGSQLFGIVVQTIAAAGLALWPIYAKARSTSQVRSPIKPAGVFLLAGLGLGGIMAFAAPYIVHFLSDGKVVLDGWVIVGFVAFVSVQALKYPLGMYMTDARGLRFQVLPIIILLPINLGLSWYLIGVIGAGGPVLASAISAFLCQALPYFWYVQRDLRVRRAAAGEPPPV